MKQAGWFSNVNGIIVGRVMYPSGYYDDFTYQDALKKIFGEEIPIIFNADIGHVCPKMTMINGSMVDIFCEDNKGSINFRLD
jgi:muramoyltetrapeptide carboxypeptidase LdcA involved in peptidoglycan recycling